MRKQCWTDLNQILSRNLKYFEHKSERNLCEIYKILRVRFELDLEQNLDRNLIEILQIFVQIRCAFSAELEGNLIFYEVMMQKKRWTDLNQIWSTNLNDF